MTGWYLGLCLVTVVELNLGPLWTTPQLDLSCEACTVKVPQTWEIGMPWEFGLSLEWSIFSAGVIEALFCGLLSISRKPSEITRDQLSNTFGTTNQGCQDVTCQLYVEKLKISQGK